MTRTRYDDLSTPMPHGNGSEFRRRSRLFSKVLKCQHSSAEYQAIFEVVDVPIDLPAKKRS